jgi:hypothetical protein
MRRLFLEILTVLSLSWLVGCGPNLSSKEYGTVVEGIPSVAGAEKPYEMPRLGPPPTEEELRRLKHK